MKILHTADWHIGPQPGPVVNGKNARALDTLRCVDDLITEAEQIKPDLVIIAGDIFHVSKTWSERGISEVQDAIERIEKLSRLAPVVAIQGTLNHDGSQHYEMLTRYFSNNSNVHIYTQPGMNMIEALDGTQVAICALPGFDRGYWRAKNPGVDRIEENLTFSSALNDMIIGMRAMTMEHPDAVSVLVGHYTVEGCNTESGQTMMFSQFEPTVSMKTLETAGFDLACFGHIHRPQRLGCSAFYSGAVNALNFNDEGQPRGFYVHDVSGHAMISSTLHQLRPQKFKTIHMTEDDIRDFNLTGTMPYHDVQDAIVRVLYDCTEEQQKALNHSQMERALMNAGAFWVQEITPKTISVSVNKTTLTTENDPEANLREYLISNDVPKDEIEALMPLARDIINLVLAEGHSDKASGLFTPVEISVTNYRNYRNETFSFEDVRFCTINGQNGVGKSSLFMDAVYDALFEDPREGDLTGWISNAQDARSGAIKFTFRVGEHLWRVSRTRVKSGKATLNLSEMVDGEWQDRSSEKLRDTQDSIQRILGMDGMTLRACALIMQDQYGLFLQANKESRMQILSDILGLGIYEQMSGEAAERAADANREVRTLHARKKELADQLPDMNNLDLQLATADATIAGLDDGIRICNGHIEAQNTAIAAAESALSLWAERVRRRDEIEVEISRYNIQRQNAAQRQNEMRAIMDHQADIIEGAKQYRQAVAARDSLKDALTDFAVLSAKRAGFENVVRTNETNAQMLDQQISATALTIERLTKALDRREALEAQRAEWEKIGAAIEAADEANAAWQAADRLCTAARNKLTEARADARAAYNQRKVEIDSLRRRVAMLENSDCPNVETATCRFLADAQQAKAKLPEAEQAHEAATAASTATINALTADLTAQEAARDALSTVPNEALVQMRARQKELSGASAELAQMEQHQRDLEAARASLKDMKERQSVMVYEAETAKSEIAKVDEDIAKHQQTVEAHQRAVEEATRLQPYADKEQQLAGARDRLEAATERVTELDGQIAEASARLEACKREIENGGDAVGTLQTCKAELEKLKETLEDANRRRDAALGHRASINQQINQAKAIKASMDSIAAEISTKAIVAAQCDMLKQAFGSNGIPHNITRSIIPIFEATASNILGQMSRGRMSVELVTEKVLKSNSKKEITTLDVVINDADTGRLPYLSRSGGERVKAALSVILALSEVMKNKLGVQLGFLFLDEPPFLDADGVRAYVEALEAIQRRYADMRIMAITHDEAMKSMFPQSVMVIKDENGSHAALE